MINKVREKGELVRRFILEHIESHTADIAALAAEKFGITRQAVNKHLTRLREQGTITKEGEGCGSSYKLVQLFEQTFSYTTSRTLSLSGKHSLIRFPGFLPGNIRRSSLYL